LEASGRESKSYLKILSDSSHFTTIFPVLEFLNLNAKVTVRITPLNMFNTDIALSYIKRILLQGDVAKAIPLKNIAFFPSMNI